MKYETSEVYYRIYLTPQRPEICAMQWFDEPDYDQSKFLTEEKFASREDAIKWLRGNRVKELMDLANSIVIYESDPLNSASIVNINRKLAHDGVKLAEMILDYFRSGFHIRKEDY